MDLLHRIGDQDADQVCMIIVCEAMANHPTYDYKKFMQINGKKKSFIELLNIAWTDVDDNTYCTSISPTEVSRIITQNQQLHTFDPEGHRLIGHAIAFDDHLIGLIPKDAIPSNYYGRYNIKREDDFIVVDTLDPKAIFGGNFSNGKLFDAINQYSREYNSCNIKTICTS